MQNLELHFKPSKKYVAIMTALFCVSLLLVISVAMPPWLKLLLLLLVGMYGYKTIWQYGLLRSKDSILALRFLSDDSWRVITRQADYYVEILGDSTVTSIASVLRLKIKNQSKMLICVVLPDSLPRDMYRRMCVFLRHG